MALVVNELTFKQEVIGSTVPVLVNFWAPWCGICRLVTPMLTEVQSEWGEHIKLVSINADENLKLASTHRLTTLPTILLFHQGQVLYRAEQFKGRDDLRQAMVDLKARLDQTTLRYSYSA